VTTIVLSARRAFRTLRTVVCSSYVFATGKRLLGFTPSDSAIRVIIVTPQRTLARCQCPWIPCSLTTDCGAKIVGEDEPDACTGL
jgi:hypothetical protein